MSRDYTKEIQVIQIQADILGQKRALIQKEKRLSELEISLLQTQEEMAEIKGRISTYERQLTELENE
jgi:hypothetical protein